MSAKILNRIITGYIPVIFLGQKCILHDANSIVKYECDLYYDEMLEHFLEEGVLSKQDLEAVLLEKGIWKKEYDDEIILRNKQIESAYEILPSLKFKSVEKKNLLLIIDQHKARVAELNKIKAITFKNSAEYLADVERLKYHFYSCLTMNGQRVWATWEDFNLANGNAILDAMNNFSDEYNITEKDIRLLARSEPWRTMWRTAEKHGSLFGKAAIEMTDYQRALCSWSLIYDSAFQSYNPPSFDIVNNDEEFDAWLSSKSDAKDPIKTGNAKIDNSPELGVFVDTIEDAAKVYNLNDAATKAKLASRNKMILEKGEVKESEFADVKQDLKMAINAKTEKRKYG